MALFLGQAVQVLVGKGDFGAEQQDHPAPKQPDKQEEEIIQGPVNGVVVGGATLNGGEDPLGHLPDRAPDNAPQHGGPDIDPGVDHDQVDKDKGEPQQAQGDQPPGGGKEDGRQDAGQESG